MTMTTPTLSKLALLLLLLAGLAFSCPDSASPAADEDGSDAVVLDGSDAVVVGDAGDAGMGTDAIVADASDTAPVADAGDAQDSAAATDGGDALDTTPTTDAADVHDVMAPDSADSADSGDSSDAPDASTLADVGDTGDAIGSTDGGDASDAASTTDAPDSADAMADVAGDAAADVADASDSGPPPEIVATFPLGDALDVLPKVIVTVTFDQEMAPLTLTEASFTLTTGVPATAVPGTVAYANSKAQLKPDADLDANTSYTATLTTEVASAYGLSLVDSYSWSFTTGEPTVSAQPVNLGAAGNFVILAKTGVSTVPASAITGDIGVSPAAATYVTGFDLIADSTNEFATSTQVTGAVYASDYAPPTPSNLTTAVSDMLLAFADAAGRAPGVTELGAGDVGGMVLGPGVYKWGSGLAIPADVTLDGSATDVWIFQIAQDLTVAGGAKVLLAGEALPENVFWQVAGLVVLGTGAHCEGVVLTQTSVTLGTGASVNGRLLAQTAVSLDASTVVAPAN